MTVRWNRTVINFVIKFYIIDFVVEMWLGAEEICEQFVVVSFGSNKLEHTEQMKWVNAQYMSQYQQNVQ